jgi:formate-dependent phosphoribosylglycinamide formyltransferase (GAR transformylase)
VCEGKRRLAVCVASADTLDEARARAARMATAITIDLD